MCEHDEKLRAAYALNLCTVSVSQIVDYNDINVLEQEYENILQNLNLEQIIKDASLKDVIDTIMDTIRHFKMAEGDKAMIDAEYQHKVKNAVWSAIPNIGAIFVQRDPVLIGLTLASQIGTGYMNYRRNRAEYQLGREKEYWQLRRNAIDQLNGLQKELFSTAWQLASKYNFPDEYRLTERQIHEYNKILMEQNTLKRYNRLDAIRNQFSAYPHFWYQIGSTANSVYRNTTLGLTPEIKAEYKKRAIECFERYRELNRFNVLRHDILTSAWALEYVDMLDITDNQERERAKELVATAEKHAGDAKDVLELCAYTYLKLEDYDSAAKIFKFLVNADYNPDINAKILSGIYISESRQPHKNAQALAEYQMLSLITNPDYLLPMPAPDEEWFPVWENGVSADGYSHSGTPENEEIVISQIVHVSQGETKRYQNKTIRIHSFINCEGTLEFDTCVIHYGESGREGVIRLAESANLSIKCCTIENHSYGKQYLIEALCKSSVSAISCVFSNCSYFIKTDGQLSLDGCHVVCPGEKFVSAYGSDHVSVSGSKITLQDKPSFYPEAMGAHIISANKLTLSESKIEGNLNLPLAEHTTKDTIADRYGLFSMEEGTVKNVSISRCGSIFHGGYRGEIIISLCSFESCYSCAVSGLFKMEDCVFSQCSKIAIGLDKGSQINNCQFNSCFCDLILTGFDGGVSLSFCEFNNWHSNEPRDTLGYSVGWSDPAMLTFRRSSRSGLRNTIQHCIFNGAIARQGFLIEGDILEKVNGVVALVDNCRFSNCTTERQSGKIIKEYAQYYGRFNAKKEQQVVTISNCQGLDRINKESGQNTEVVIKTKNSVGATIGVGAAFAVAGVPGYVVASLIKKATADDDIHIE